MSAAEFGVVDAKLASSNADFFSGAGYDQGMMGGVNGALDYVTTMGLGYVTPGVDGGKPTATVTQSTKQVSRFLGNASCLVSLLRRS